MKRAMTVLLVLAFAAARSPAQPAPEPSKPWAVGVSESDQQVALALYDEGNAAFQQARFRDALDKYLEAIKHWDHPAIRYNMAICYNNLGLLLEAADNLERGLAYGEAPLGHDIFAQGLNYRANFASRLARVKIVCKEPDTQVSLDGKPLFVGPGEAERLVLPGELHQIVATKPGFNTASETLQLAAGSTKLDEIRLVAFKVATPMVRRWAWWKPWMVGGAGAAVVGLGLAIDAFASNNFATYDAGVLARCPHGCDAMTLHAFADLNDAKHRGEVERDVAGAMLVVGGAAIVTAAVGVYLNQPHALEHVAPTPLPGGAGVRASWSF